MCELCEGLGFIRDENGDAAPCTCQEGGAAISRRALRSVPARFRSCTWGTWSGEKPNLERWWTRWWCILILGPTPGTGKTHMATAIYLETAPILPAVSPLWARAGSIISRASEEIAGKVEKKVESATKTSDLLVLDDLGAHRDDKFSTPLLADILFHRYDNMLLTIITANASTLEDFDTNPRLSSRLAHDTLVIKRKGADRRLPI